MHRLHPWSRTTHSLARGWYGTGTSPPHQWLSAGAGGVGGPRCGIRGAFPESPSQRTEEERPAPEGGEARREEEREGRGGGGTAGRRSAATGEASQCREAWSVFGPGVWILLSRLEASRTRLAASCRCVPDRACPWVGCLPSVLDRVIVSDASWHVPSHSVLSEDECMYIPTYNQYLLDWRQSPVHHLNRFAEEVNTACFKR